MLNLNKTAYSERQYNQSLPMIHPVRDVVVISYFQRSFGKLVVELNRIGEYVQGIIKLYHEKNQ